MSRTGDVLVVDDDRAIAELIDEVLRDEGYDVRVAYDAAQAVSAISAARPGLLLMDVRLPGIDGATLLNVLQGHRLGATPVVLMSADRALLRSITDGVSGYLDKPFDLETLLRCVSEHYARLPEPQV